LNKEILLTAQMTRAPEIIEWFADEENPEKRAAAFQLMILYANMLQMNNLRFAITGSMNEFLIDASTSFYDFVPFNELAPLNSHDPWFFTAADSGFDFTMSQSLRRNTDTPLLWIDHKVIENGITVGVISVALELGEVFHDLFAPYDNRSVRGGVIDHRGIIQKDSAMPELFFISADNQFVREEIHILSVNSDADFVAAINNNYLRNPAIYYGRRTEPEVIRLSGGAYQYLAIAPVPNTNWLVITFYDSGALFDFSSILPPIGVVVLAFLIYITASSVLIQRKVFKPLNQFTDSVSVSGYDESAIYGVDRDDEIGDLARAARKAWGRLKAALESANIANQSKSSFLANMSHEIRTPMNVIMGVTEILMQNETLDKTASKELNTIHSSGDLLLNIINDILDLSKIEAGKLELMPVKYEMASLINNTVALNVMRNESRPIEFKLHVDENLPAAMYGDELRIRQIMNNLLSNAFKYTAEGEAALSFNAEDNGGEIGLTLIVSVSDTGYGMTEEQVSKLFDEYTRFNQKANRTTEGTGLGMNITRNLLRLMGGELSVESELHKGSVFTARIPQGRVGTDVLGSELTGKLQDFHITGIRQIKKANIVYEPMPYGKVLIVDDVGSNLFVAKGLMAPYELSIDTAASGYEAIDKIKGGNVYDIVFMDYMTPKMDGMEAANIIRGLGYTRPIVALAANAVVGQMEIFLANGFDDFISKPIDIRYLNAVLKKFARDTQPAGVIEAARKQASDTERRAPNGAAHPTVSPQFIEYFVKDVLNAVAALEAMDEKRGVYEEEDIMLYTTTAHAMKTTLANAGEAELSAFAANLEKAGCNKDIAVMSAGTPAFLSRLHGVFAKFAPQAGEDADI